MPPVTNPVFGRILLASDIEEAVTVTLQKWYPAYLAELARQLDISPNDLPRPQNYTNRNSFDTTIGEKIPKVVVISPGLMGPPLMRGGGMYAATWRLGVGVATADKEEDVANMHVKAYAAATRAILLQATEDLALNLDGFAHITWLEESYDDMAIPNQHQLYKSASLFFAIDVENVVTKGKGPSTPTITAPPALTTVQTIDIDVVKLP